MGMEAFAERARGELTATGETVRKRTVATRDELTPTQRQIALRARHVTPYSPPRSRDGMSNGDIGPRLLLSPRTVEWPLGNAFSKLGINSRRELAAALARA